MTRLAAYARAALLSRETAPSQTSRGVVAVEGRVAAAGGAEATDRIATRLDGGLEGSSTAPRKLACSISDIDDVLG